MDTFLKATACIFVALILYLILAKHNKDLSTLLTVAVCCLIGVSAVNYLQPVVQFISKLQGLGNLNSDMLEIILKAVGIALLTEITSLVCIDAGNSSLGKVLQMIAVAVILWISLPLFASLIDLVEEILESI